MKGPHMIDFKALAKHYEQEMIQDLVDLIAFPSLTDETSMSKDAPFGQPLKETLDWFLSRCEQLGFDVDNVDGYAGVASLGKQASTLGILGHLDVVPVGEGWSKDPFKAVIEDGVIFGRGTGDDKGPTIAALYAMRMLKDLNIPLKHKLQLIVGVDEETGMRCMDYFTKHRKAPDFGFVPDAYFPLIYGEKGIANIVLASQKPTIIRSFNAGERPNIVIGKASFVINAKHDQQGFEWYKKAHRLEMDVNILDEHRVEYIAYGDYTHASTPHKGINAAYHACNFVGSVYHDELALEAATLISDVMGRSLNIAFDGVHMGWLSTNCGIVRASENSTQLTIDIRYPNDVTFDWITSRIDEKLSSTSFKSSVIAHKEPHFVDPSSQLVQTLHRVYKEYSGDEFTPPLTMGGGTYARTMPNFVAYGMKFITKPQLTHVGDAHQKDEGIEIEDLVLASAIYAKALYDLAYEDA
jgi:succinyl-diaminopimelate desuccinylase